MQEEGAEKAGGVMHCFTESLAVAQAAMDLGFYLLLRDRHFQECAGLAGGGARGAADRLLIETDSPYLAPMPYRGTNEPSFVPVAQGRRVEKRHRR